MAKNLFKVVNKATGKTVGTYDVKESAKVLRDSLNIQAGYKPNPEDPKGLKEINSGANMPFKVSYAEDHPCYS